jgi:hypothetical protein
LEHFGDVGSLDDNVESFLSNDDGDARDIFAALKPDHNPTTKGTHLTFLFICVLCVYQRHLFWEHSTEMTIHFLLSGFTFNEVRAFSTSNKLVCCHFSSDGKYLASAGHEKKVLCGL